jgi:hypothetical protein
MPVGAALGAAGITAAGSIIGGNQAAKGASKAADTQMQMYQTTRNDLMPYNQAGQGDFAAYNHLITGSPAEQEARLQALPGYQFTRTQGLKSVQNSATARGLGVSGAAMKGAAQYATGLADSTFGNQANLLFQGAGLGENAAAQTGNTAAAIAGGVGRAQTAVGAAQAAGTVGATQGAGLGLLNYGMYGHPAFDTSAYNVANFGDGGFGAGGVGGLY